MTINFEQGIITSVLSHWGVIRVSGVDARSFLHSQLTQDVQNLGENETRLAGYCSVKGRLYAVLQIFAVGEVVYLVTRRGLIEGLIKRLKMFVLRAKVILEDISDVLQIQGICSSDALVFQHMQVDGDGFRLGVLPAYIDGVAYARELRLTTNAVEGEALAEVWDWLDICAGMPHIESATSEAFVPQMINLDRINGVNFKKGCYPGQEIVARSHYLGKLKRRMQIASLLFSNESRIILPKVGNDVMSSVDGKVQPIGQVVAAAVHPLIHHQVDILYEVNMPSLMEGTDFSVVNIEADWQAMDLPYPLSEQNP